MEYPLPVDTHLTKQELPLGNFFISSRVPKSRIKFQCETLIYYVEVNSPADSTKKKINIQEEFYK